MAFISFDTHVSIEDNELWTSYTQTAEWSDGHVQLTLVYDSHFLENTVRPLSNTAVTVKLTNRDQTLLERSGVFYWDELLYRASVEDKPHIATVELTIWLER